MAGRPLHASALGLTHGLLSVRHLVLCLGALSTAWQCSSPTPGPVPAPVSPGVTFVDVATPMGLVRRHTGGGLEKRYIVEAKGGGAAVLDFDGDDDLDIYWVNGATLEHPDRGGGSALYRNDNGSGFTDVAVQWGVEGRGWGMGAVSADYDNDGDADLFVTTLQQNLLYRNDGRGFTDVSAASGADARGWSTGAAFADYDLDGDLDLYVAQYVDFDFAQVRPLGSKWKGVDAFVGPLSLVPTADVFYRNHGDGTFTEVTAEAGLTSTAPGYGLAVLFADYDLDGLPDLYVANDSSPNFLFHNEGSGRFADVSMTTSTAYGQTGQAQAGMGAAWGDYDNDTFPDLFVTNFEDDYNTLYRNRGGGGYEDVSFVSGVGRASLLVVGFGTSFLDFDNDTDLDLFVANGHVYPQVDGGGTGVHYRQPDHLFENVGNGRFRLLLPQEGDSLGSARVSRGSCVFDFDDDGDLDIFVSNLNDRPSLLRNDVGQRQAWIAIELTGTSSNRDAIGARLRLIADGVVQVRQILSGSSFLSGETKHVHFGLGAATVADSLEIRWPSGMVQRFAGLPVNTRLQIVEGEEPSTRVPGASW